MKPDIRFEEVRSFGNHLRMLHQTFYCPKCGGLLLNAVPGDPQERCDDCGEELDFTDVEFVEDKIIGVDREWRA